MVEIQQAIALAADGFDPVAVFDGLKMLPGKSHDQQKQAAEGNSKLLHFAAAAWVLHFYKTRVINGLGEVNFRSSRPAGLSPAGMCHHSCACRCCHYATPTRFDSSIAISHSASKYQ